MRGPSHPVFLMILVMLAGCAATVESPEPHESTEVTLWLSPTYDGATVCVEGTCDLIDGDDTLVLRPGLVGSTFEVHVSMGDVELLLEGSHALDLETLGLDPDTARIDAFSLLLLRRSTSDPRCTLGKTNLRTEGTVAFGDYPGELSEQPCGPFVGE